MPVQFAGNIQADLGLVLALWHELIRAWYPERDEPMRTIMQRGHAKESLARLLRADVETKTPHRTAMRACRFDVVLRLASGRIDTMHADHPFFERADNGRYFNRVPMPRSTVAGVQLTEAALAEWTDIGAGGRERALDEARRLLESDVESGGIIVRLLPQHEAATVPAVPAEEATGRTAYLRALVRDIDADPFQPVYRQRPFGQAVTGWRERLLAYFWPAPHLGYRETCAAVEALATSSGRLAQALSERGAWSESEQADAVALAHAVFKWGGVPQDPETVTPSTVQAVYEAALRNDPAAQARMNSGWTKVAAFATAHHESSPDAHPQVIWDSRVAASVASRLERVVPAHVDMAALFPGVGTVPGRGGTRPRELARKWPSAYGSWRGQVAGSQIVREIRDILNKDSYRLPPGESEGEGDAGRWTTRDVEMVLFMDGY